MGPLQSHTFLSFNLSITSGSIFVIIRIMIFMIVMVSDFFLKRKNYTSFMLCVNVDQWKYYKRILNKKYLSCNVIILQCKTEKVALSVL